MKINKDSNGSKDNLHCQQPNLVSYVLARNV